MHYAGEGQWSQDGVAKLAKAKKDTTRLFTCPSVVLTPYYFGECDEKQASLELTWKMGPSLPARLGFNKTLLLLKTLAASQTTEQSLNDIPN